MNLAGKSRRSKLSFQDLGRVGSIGVKRFVGMCRGCPDLSKWVGGVSGFGRKILRWPEKVTGGAGWVWPAV